MPALAEPPPMAKRNDETARIDSEVMRLARVIAASRNQTVAEYLSNTLKPLVTRDYAEFIAKEAKGIEKPPKR